MNKIVGQIGFTGRLDNQSEWKLILNLNLRVKKKNVVHLNFSKFLLGTSLVTKFNFPLLFANSPGDRGSIPGGFISKTQKMVLDAALLNT